MTFTKSRLAVAVMAVTAGLAYAEDKPAEQPTLMDQVTVTATRSSQTLESTAASVSVITDEEMEADLAQDLRDVFEYTPGVTINDSNRQGVQSVNIRGMEGKRVKILVDGVSQPDAFDGGVYEFINSSAATVEVDMLKSVEVVKGAASSLQGSDAIGGVVAFETKDPSDFLKGGKEIGGQAKLSYSSKDKSFSEHVAVAKKFGDDVEAMVAYTRRDGGETQNFTDNPTKNYSVKDQDYANNDVLVKVQGQLNDNHRLEFSGEVIHNKADSDIVSTSYQNVKGEDTTKQETAALKHIWFADGALADTVTSRLSWLSKEENGITNRFMPGREEIPAIPGIGFPGMPATADNQQKKDYFYNEDNIEFETQLDKSIGNHYLVYGLSFKDSDISNVNTEYNNAADREASRVITYTPKAKEQAYGLYLQDEISIGDRLVLSPGIRYDNFETNPGSVDGETYKDFSDSAVTGRLGATYRISTPGVLFAQVSQGFRAPSFDELYYVYDGSAYGISNLANPDLKSEKSTSYELGYRHNNAISSTEVSAFYSDYTDFIEHATVGTLNGITQYQYVNIGEATIKGVELSNSLDWHAIADLPEGVTTRFIAAYTEGESGDGHALNSVNPWNAVIAFNYDSPDSKWGTSLKVNYTAEKSNSDINSDSANGGTTNQVELPSATVVDLTAYYKPVSDLTIRAGIMNLTNKKYYKWNDVRGDTSLSLDETQAERNYSISVKYDF